MSAFGVSGNMEQPSPPSSTKARSKWDNHHGVVLVFGSV